MRAAGLCHCTWRMAIPKYLATCWAYGCYETVFIYTAYIIYYWEKKQRFSSSLIVGQPDPNLVGPPPVDKFCHIVFLACCLDSLKILHVYQSVCQTLSTCPMVWSIRSIFHASKSHGFLPPLVAQGGPGHPAAQRPADGPGLGPALAIGLAAGAESLGAAVADRRLWLQPGGGCHQPVTWGNSCGDFGKNDRCGICFFLLRGNEKYIYI